MKKKQLFDLYYHEIEDVHFFDMDEVDPDRFTVFCEGMDVSYIDVDDMKGVFCWLPNEMCLINKLHPHAQYDMMIITMQKRKKLSLDDLSIEEKKTVMGTCVDFFRFVFKQENICKYGLDGGYPYIVFNCDPGMNDRKSGMSIKRFHVHLCCWKKENIISIEKNKKQAEILDGLLRRRILDPVTQLGYRIITDSIKEVNNGEVSICECNNLRFLNKNIIKINGGADVLASESFITFMDRLHAMINQKYRLCKAAFLGENPIRKAWNREPLLEKKEIRRNIARLPFNDDIKDKIYILADILRDISDEEMKLMKTNKRLSSHYLALEDLFYSIAFYQNDYIDVSENNTAKPLYMIIKTSLFSDIGGAGVMSFPTAPITMIDRKQTKMSEQDQYYRFLFQHDFVKYLRGR